MWGDWPWGDPDMRSSRMGEDTDTTQKTADVQIEGEIKEWLNSPFDCGLKNRHVSWHQEKTTAGFFFKSFFQSVFSVQYDSVKVEFSSSDKKSEHLKPCARAADQILEMPIGF